MSNKLTWDEFTIFKLSIEYSLDNHFFGLFTQIIFAFIGTFLQLFLFYGLVMLAIMGILLLILNNNNIIITKDFYSDIWKKYNPFPRLLNKPKRHYFYLYLFITITEMTFMVALANYLHFESFYDYNFIILTSILSNIAFVIALCAIFVLFSFCKILTKINIRLLERFDEIMVRSNENKME